MKKEKKVFAICDLEEAYVVHLAHYLNQKSDLPFRVMAFTSLSSLIEYASGNEIEILLISTDAMSEEVRNLNVHRIIILSDGETPSLGTDDPQIDKYQDSDTIARLVCGYAGAANTEMKKSLGSCRLIGVYSPVSRCGKTMFCLTLAQALARSGKVLYLNLESWSGLEDLLQANWREDLADLMYAARSELEDLTSRLEGIVKTYGTLDICPPSFFPEDLRETDIPSWMEFFAALSNTGNYTSIILDIGDQIKDGELNYTISKAAAKNDTSDASGTDAGKKAAKSASKPKASASALKGASRSGGTTTGTDIEAIDVSGYPAADATVQRKGTS